MRAHRAWALIVLGACHGRCSGNGSGPIDDACGDWAAHYCNRLAFCAPLSMQIAYGDVVHCGERNRPVCASALRANGTGQNPKRLETCAHAYDSAPCEDIVVGKPPRACNASGALGAGDVCGDDWQCPGANGYCRTPSEQTCGTCSVLGPPGAGCFSDRDCEYGLVCYFTCMAPVAAGAACDGMARQCPATLVCFNYTCASPGAADAPCDPRADHCDRDHGLVCDPQARVCSHYVVAGIGSACGTGTTCRAGSCVTDPRTHDATCVASAVDGAHCDEAMGPSCMAPARCVGGTCRLPDPSSCH